MHTKKIASILALTSCLCVILAGCNKTESKDIVKEQAETKEISSEAAPVESTPDTEASVESTTDEQSENVTETAADDYIEIICDGELITKVPAKPLDSWTLDYELTEEEIKEEVEYFGYIGYNYHDEKDNWYGYNFYPDSNTWKLIMFWPYDNTGTGYYLNEEDGTWFISDGRDG